MKAISPTAKTGAAKPFTFGDLVVAVYGASNERRARALLKFAVNAHLVVFPKPRHFVIS